ARIWQLWKTCGSSTAMANSGTASRETFGVKTKGRLRKLLPSDRLDHHQLGGRTQVAMVRRERVYLRRRQGPQRTPAPYECLERHHATQGAHDASCLGHGVAMEIII
ncbi:unnamed protein product, partial [Ascophyllum nodosum]